MINNPFTSDVFTGVWAKHFNKSAQGTSFPLVKNLSFTKHKQLPLYTNYGRTHTKGIKYHIDNSNIQDLKGKVMLIYDVPVYFDVPEIRDVRFKQNRIKQYPGFLINLEKYNSLDDFMIGTFKKTSRYKLKKYNRKLETCFDINYKMFHGQISKEEFEVIFESFRDLLAKRFDDKAVTNNNLDKREWDFYHEVAYPMILEKKAGLFVIYNSTQPIAVTLVYFSENILFDAITVFDIDYAKFHLGSVTIMKLIEWSIEQKIEIFDFSKGYFDYKKRWASKEYDFEYHILYDTKSLIAILIARCIKIFFETKQFLRDKKVNEILHRQIYMLRHKSAALKEEVLYKFYDLEDDYRNEELVHVDFNTTENKSLNKIVFDFLYLKNEKLKDVTLYQFLKDKSTYLLKGKSVEVKVELAMINRE